MFKKSKCFFEESVCSDSFYWLSLVVLCVQSWTMAGTILQININICRTRASRFASASPAVHDRCASFHEYRSAAIHDQRVHEMTSIDFAAAQQRVEERHRLREAGARTRSESLQNQEPLSALVRLPSPFNYLGSRGLQAWYTIKGREGTRPAYRVGQVDAELLDEELLDLLKGQVGEGLKYFGVRFMILSTTST